MKKTYCIFSAVYLPSLGGVERYTYNLAKNLSAQGNKVIIVTCDIFHTSHLKQVEELKEVEVIRLPCINWLTKILKGRFQIIKFNKNFRKYIQQLDENVIDAIIINTRFYMLSLYAARYAKKRNIDSIVIEHGTSHFTVNNKILDFLGQIYEHSVTWVLRKLVKDFYGVSKACGTWLQHFKISSKGECYNAIDLEEIEKLSREAVTNYRKKYDLTDEDIIITYTGRILREKGIEELVETVEHLPAYYHLFIAGDGPLYEKVSNLNNNRIKLLGRLTFKEVVGLLNESDIFCLPSYSEGFSTSLLEAVACRCFIITSDTGGAKELIQTEQDGIVLDKVTERDIAKAIEKASNDKAYRDKAIENAWAQLNKHFTWEKTTAKIIEIFENGL